MALEALDDRVRTLTQIYGSFFARRNNRRVIASFLYGSVQTKAWRPDSDVDIAILDHPEDRIIWDEQAILMDELERLTGQPTDLRMLRDCLVSHQAQVLTRGTLIWVSAPGILEAYQRSLLQEFQRSIPTVHHSWVSLLKELSGGARLPRDTD